MEWDCGFGVVVVGVVVVVVVVAGGDSCAIDGVNPIGRGTVMIPKSKKNMD